MVKMYRRRGRGVAISLYDPLPSLLQKPGPAYKNIVAMAIKVNEYLKTDTQRTYTDAGAHFGVSRARVSQLMTIFEKLPDDFIEMMGQCNDQTLITRFSGKTLLKIACIEDVRKRKKKLQLMLFK